MHTSVFSNYRPCLVSVNFYIRDWKSKHFLFIYLFIYFLEKGVKCNGMIFCNKHYSWNVLLRGKFSISLSHIEFSPPPQKKSYLNNLNFEISERNFSLNACSSVTEHITTITIIPPFLVFSNIAVLWATRVPALIYVQQIYIFKWFSTNVTYNYRFIFLRKTPSQSIKLKEMNFFLL